MTLTLLVLTFVTLQRLGELVIAQRNTARLLGAGAVEVAPGHYPLMVALHAAWLIGLWYFAVALHLASPDPALLLVFFVLQGLRVWVLMTLGPRWTTRIIVTPGEKLVAAGPYRFLRHPNYIVLAAEVATLPVVFGLWWYAALFSALNLAMLAWRIVVEEHALAPPRQKTG